MDDYEYIGGLVGKQSKPGYIQNSFYDNRFAPEETISKGALVIIGQDRETMEVIDGFKESEGNYESLKNYYEVLTDQEQNIVNEAYKSDTQDWYLGGEMSGGTINNFIVLSEQGYSIYYNKTSEYISEIEQANIGSSINASNINFLSQEMVYEQTFETGDIRIYNLESIYSFSPSIWDYNTVDSNSSEPLKLKREIV